MAQPQILEGMWEEILSRNAVQLAGRKVKVYIETEEEVDTPAFPPNEKALAALRQIAKLQEGMRDTDGSQTERIIREGRDGGMYNDAANEHDAAVSAFEALMSIIQPPPNGKMSLARRGFKIGNAYGCSRSADAVYIGLAEELTQTRPTVLLTFDQGIPNQATKNAPTVTVQVLNI